MTKEWGEGYAESIRKHFAQNIIHRNERGEKVINTSDSTLALMLATLGRLERLENRFKTMEEDQKKILEILERLDNPPLKKGKTAGPSPRSSS